MVLANEDYSSESMETTDLSDWDDDAFAAFADEAVEEEAIIERLVQEKLAQGKVVFL